MNCPYCQGEGEIAEKVCTYCKGQGEVWPDDDDPQKGRLMADTTGYQFVIEHIDPDNFYIQVTDPDGFFSYDGYWQKLDATIEDALNEALAGSKLVPRSHGTPSLPK